MKPRETDDPEVIWITERDPELAKIATRISKKRIYKPLTVNLALRHGEDLSKAKQKVPRGLWREWLRVYWRKSFRVAQRYMSIWESPRHGARSIREAENFPSNSEQTKIGSHRVASGIENQIAKNPQKSGDSAKTSQSGMGRDNPRFSGKNAHGGTIRANSECVDGPRIIVRKKNGREIVQCGSASVRIIRCQGRKKKDGGRYGDYWRFRNSLTGKDDSDCDHDQLVARAKRFVADLSKGKLCSASANLDGSQIDQYLRNIDKLKPFNETLDFVVDEWVATQRGGRINLEKLVRTHRDTYAGIVEKPLTQIVEGFLLKKRKLCPPHVDWLTCLLLGQSRIQKNARPSFCSRFKNYSIGAIKRADVMDWLSGPKHSAVTFNKELRAIKMFFYDARRDGYLPKNWDELDGIDYQKDKRPDLVSSIYTPDQLALYLSSEHLSDDVRTVQALRAFIPIRIEEALKFDWSYFNTLGDDVLWIPGDESKTCERTIPLPANLVAWLKPFQKPSGPFWDSGLTRREGEDQRRFFQRVKREFNKKRRKQEAKIQGFKSSQNAWRHSCISYMLKLMPMSEVVTRAGNSRDKVLNHYQNVRFRPELAKAWFSIMPPWAKEKIVDFKSMMIGLDRVDSLLVADERKQQCG